MSRLPRINRRHAPRLLAFFTSLFMSFLMSGFVTLINVGLPADFLGRWMHAFVLAFAVAFPTILAVMPIARHLVERLTAD